MSGVRAGIILRLLGAVALGALTTVAVAWAISRRSAYPAAQQWSWARDRAGAEGEGFLRASCSARVGVRNWNTQAIPPDWPGGITALEREQPRTEVPADARPLVLPWLMSLEPWPSDGAVSYSAHGYGWPMPALAARLRFDSPKNRAGPLTAPEWHGVIAVAGLATSGRNIPPGLPVWVLPRGFAADTALAAGLWGALLLYPAARRALRRRRGRCPRCGYDLRHDLTSGCPECGWNRAPATPAPG